MGDKNEKTRPTLGLALSGGSARGLAHIGVLKVLAENNIKIDYIAGTSMGGVVGAFYANGMNISMIHRLVKRLERRLWMDFTLPKMGIIAGEKIMEILCFLTRNRTFAELQIPFAVSATDLYSGTNVTLKEGRVGEAVRATISIPGFFPPVPWGEYLLVDGGVLNRVPVDVVKEMGADIIIAVDVGMYVGVKKINNIFDVITRSIDIMSWELEKDRVIKAHVVICPEMKDVAPLHFHKVDEAVAQGEEATRKVLTNIKNLLGRKD